MWSRDTTDGRDDLVWGQPETGIAPSALKGTANLQNVNIATQPGAVAAAFGRSDQAQAAISSGTLTPDGDTLFDAPATLLSGAWIKVTASTVSSVTAATNPTEMSFDYLAVGGGGGGGNADNSSASGGGGGGEVATGSDTLAVGKYNITIGEGGNGGELNQEAGTDGEDTVIETVVTAVGGGGGGSSFGSNIDGRSGGSGGGGGSDNTSTAGTGGSATAGNDGGAGHYNATVALRAGGGGGGAGAAGTAGASDNGGDGGDGVSSSITGTATFYGGGGGGGADGTQGSGGDGGGGNGGVSNAGEDGEVNTGGGGGGAATLDTNDNDGGDGGSGIVVISYPTGSAYCIGGEISFTATNTIHTFKSTDIFEVISVSSGGLYYVSFKDDSDQIKLSELYDPNGTDVLTHGTTGTVTFDVLATPNQPVAKATERYFTSTGKEYRYYLLDANSRVWVYDTAVYDATLAANNVGVTWMLADPTDYSSLPIKGMEVLNGWLFYITTPRILCKPTVNLGAQAGFMENGWMTNPYDNHPNFAYVGSQGTLLYTDGNYLGEIFPTNSLITSIANLQSYGSYTGSGTTGTVSTLIGGAIPYAIDGSRVPVVFFAELGGTLPDSVSVNTVYFVEYDPVAGTFSAYTALVGGSVVNLETGATGTQYFNTFWPIGNDAGDGGTNPTLQFTSQRLNLPFYETAKRMVEIGNTILIGCEGNVVYPWNQVDAIPSDVITLPEDDVQAMLNVNNTAYIFAGDKGNIYITNGGVASLTLTIPDYTAGVPGTPTSYIEPTFLWGDAIYVRGRVYCSILDQTATKTGNCGGNWSFIPSENVDPLQAVGSALRLENQNSYGDYDGYAPILINDRDQDGNSPKYWAAWQNDNDVASAGFGIDYSTENPVTTYVIETDALVTGTFLTKRTFEQLEYKMSAPLRAGESVAMYYRTDPTATWTEVTNEVTESDNGFSGWWQVNFQKTQWLQLRAEVTTTGDATTSNFAPLNEIRLR
jgi:hypothetical protein